MAMNREQLIANYPFNPDPTVPFSGTDELSAAMMSPKYANDPAYRAIVESRMAAGGVGKFGLSDQREQIHYTSLPGGWSQEQRW